MQYTDIDDPRREKLRSEIAEPRWMKSRIDKLDPNRAIP
jgi:hypothetical protein